MRPEISGGTIIFRRYKKRREYLLLHYEAGHWDFPKGHVEGKETLEQAALRELFEETGLRQARFSSGFRHTIRYWILPYRSKLKERPRRRIMKFVTFFVGETQKSHIRLSHEHTGYVWLPYREAMKLVTYDNAKTVLAKAEAFIGGKR